MERCEDIEMYISGSKRNIDNYISKHEYRKAFKLLILFLERLNNKEKAEVIGYYSKNLKRFGILHDIFLSE